MENLKPDTREKIIQGSVDLFQKMGVKSLSMDDIARSLGMSKKTLYLHFSDKQDILKACVNKHFEHQECKIGNIQTENLAAVEEVFRMMELVSQQLRQMAGAHRLIHDIQQYYPEAWSRFREHKEQFVIARIEENLRKGIEEGVYRPEIDVRIIARIRASEMDAMLNPDLFPLIDYNLNQLFDQLLLYFLYGVCTPKGDKILAKLLRKKHRIENP
jgi:AcrR family transcriptional regulator